MKVLVKNITNKGFNSSKHSFKKYETKECYFTDEVIAGQQLGDYKVWEEFLRLQDRGLLQITQVPSTGVLDAPTLNGLTVAQIIAASSVSTLEGVGWEKAQATTASYAITKPASGVGLDLHIEVGGSLATLNSTSWPVPASGVDQLRIRNFSGSAKTLTAGTGWTIVTADGNPVTNGSYSIPDDRAVEITLDPDGFAQVVPWGGEVSQTVLDAGLALKAPLASPTFTGTITMPGTGIWDSSSNVGIGTSAPAEKLHLSGTGAVNTMIETTAPAGPVVYWLKNPSIYAAFGLRSDTNSLRIALNTGGTLNGSDGITVLQNGNAGIGTVTPKNPLQIGTGDTHVAFSPNIAATIGHNQYYDTAWRRTNSGFATLMELNSGTAGDISFSTAATSTADSEITWDQRLRIMNNGNVGIGTATPTSKLQVVGLPTYADNTAALAGGLTAGAFYRTSTGVLMVTY